MRHFLRKKKQHAETEGRSSKSVGSLQAETQIAVPVETDGGPRTL